MACPIGPAIWTPVNLSEKFPGYKIIDRNAPEYQMEAFMYTCVILLIYTVATGAFMVKFILQAREPGESGDSDSSGASSGLPMVVKLREQERHKKLVDRQARHDVKMQMINHLRQMSITAFQLRPSDERRTSVGSIETQITTFSEQQQQRKYSHRTSVSGSSLMQQRSLSKSNSNPTSTRRFFLPLSKKESSMSVERTYSDGSSDATAAVWQSPIFPYAYHPLSQDGHSSLRYQQRYSNSNDMIDDTLVSL